MIYVVFLRPTVLMQMFLLGYVYTLRLIGQISYPGECDLMVRPQKHIVILSRMHFVTFLSI